MIVISRLLRFYACRAAKIVVPSLRRNKTCLAAWITLRIQKRSSASGDLVPQGWICQGLSRRTISRCKQWANCWALQDF
jgi:hypothetical protein